MMTLIPDLGPAKKKKSIWGFSIRRAWSVVASGWFDERPICATLVGARDKLAFVYGFSPLLLRSTCIVAVINRCIIKLYVYYKLAELVAHASACMVQDGPAKVPTQHYCRIPYLAVYTNKFITDKYLKVELRTPGWTWSRFEVSW